MNRPRNLREANDLRRRSVAAYHEALRASDFGRSRRLIEEIIELDFWIKRIEADGDAAILRALKFAAFAVALTAFGFLLLPVIQ